MNKQTLYKKFFKLGSRIDYMCFHYIEYGLVENATHNLWDIIKREDIKDVQKFAEKFNKIKKTLEARMRVYNGNINSTEFKDTKLLVRLEIKHKLNKLKSAHLDLAKFEQSFLEVMGISLFETKNFMQERELKTKKI